MKEKVREYSKRTPFLPKITEYIKEKRLGIIYGVVYGVITFMFGRAELLFETSPLGLAFACTAREGVPFAVLGAVASALVAGGTIPSFTYRGLSSRSASDTPCRLFCTGTSPPFTA